MGLKEMISPPLEAGPSVLDAHRLPPQLTPALEYTSSRLAKKSLHLTLVVARRDYQLPPSPGFLSSPTSPASPSGSRITRQFARWTSRHGHGLSPRSAISSPSYTPTSLDFPSPRSPWPMTPSTPLSPPPMTPCTAGSSVATDTTGASLHPTTQCVRLIHHGNLPPKAEKALQHALAKASRKCGLGAPGIGPALNAVHCGMTKNLINNSVTQNEVLFSSDGLSLVSLDRLYSLKSALSSYSKTGSPFRLEDAVDELRRYVLAYGQVSKSDLVRSYDWLSVSNTAMADLDRMYRRAYGGPERSGGISGLSYIPEPDPLIWDDENASLVFDPGEDEDYESTPVLDEAMIGIAISTTPIAAKRSPSPKLPLLKVQTTFQREPEPPDDKADGGSEGDDDDGPNTARPVDVPSISLQLWTDTQATSIDQMLNDGMLSPQRSSRGHGPATPNGYDDISPITRGEWGFLMVDRALQGGRTVTVETC